MNEEVTTSYRNGGLSSYVPLDNENEEEEEEEVRQSRSNVKKTTTYPKNEVKRNQEFEKEGKRKTSTEGEEEDEEVSLNDIREEEEKWKEARLRPRISYWYLQVAVVLFYGLYVFTAVYVCVEPIFGSYTDTYALLTLGILGTVICLSVVSYMRAYLVSPGYIGRVQGSSLPETLDGTKYNYCAICQIYKPPRTHHCRRCNRCVLRMDHHCLWINNCVGLHNHKYFFLFIAYAWIAFFIVLALYVGRWLVYVKGIHEPSLKLYQIVLLALSTFFDLAHIMTVGWMVYFQTFLISKGRTNVEHACCEGQAEGCNFDQKSLFANWSAIFGNRVYDWLVPTRPPYEGARRQAEQFEYKVMKDVDFSYE